MIFSHLLTFPQFCPLSTKSIYNFSSSASVWHNRGRAPVTNHTAATQQLLVGLACGQTLTAPTGHYVTGNPERRPTGSKGPKQIRQLSKRVRGGSFVGTVCKYVARTHARTHHVHPLPDVGSPGLGTLTAKAKWMTTQPANWGMPFRLWGLCVCFVCILLCVYVYVKTCGHLLATTIAFFQESVNTSLQGKGKR